MWNNAAGEEPNRAERAYRAYQEEVTGNDPGREAWEQLTPTEQTKWLAAVEYADPRIRYEYGPDDVDRSKWDPTTEDQVSAIEGKIIEGAKKAAKPVIKKELEQMAARQEEVNRLSDVSREGKIQAKIRREMAKVSMDRLALDIEHNMCQDALTHLEAEGEVLNGYRRILVQWMERWGETRKGMYWLAAVTAMQWSEITAEVNVNVEGLGVKLGGLEANEARMITGVIHILLMAVAAMRTVDMLCYREWGWLGVSGLRGLLRWRSPLRARYALGLVKVVGTLGMSAALLGWAGYEAWETVDQIMQKEG